MSILGSIIQTSWGGGASGMISEEAGSTAANAAANTKRLFLDTEKNNLLTAIDENGVLTIIDEFIDTPQTTLANLETNFPAASNTSVFAWVAGTTAENGLYLSSGTAWTKQLDNSGDRSTLFDYAGGLVYSGVNDLLAGAGTITWVQSDRTTAVTDFQVGTLGQAIDGNTTAGFAMNSAQNGSFLYKTQTTPIACGKAVVTTYQPGNNALFDINSFAVVGYTATGNTFTRLTPTTVSGGSATIAGNAIVGVDGQDIITLTFDNTDDYDGYGIEIIASGAQMGLTELSFEIVTDNTNTVDCVSSINKLHAGVSKIEPTALTADTLLDDTDGVVLLDPSGADFTMTLPAVATVLTGKKYTFVLTTAPATTAVTLDGDGSETINGAATNATALTAQWDTVTIMSDGTQWIIVG